MSQVADFVQKSHTLCPHLVHVHQGNDGIVRHSVFLSVDEGRLCEDNLPIPIATPRNSGSPAKQHLRSRKMACSKIEDRRTLQLQVSAQYVADNSKLQKMRDPRQQRRSRHSSQDRPLDKVTRTI